MAIININKGNVEGRRHQAASMVQWWITPLLNTCLKKSQIRKTNNKFSIAYFLAALAVFSTLNGGFVAADPQEEISVQDGIIDVLFIDSQCIVENEECEATRAGNIIEYFGADWCEPCLEVEEFLMNYEKENTVIIQHHASVFDYSYLNYSKFRFDNKFRLLFIPSLVLNGQGLLTGTSQILELNDALGGYQMNYSGIDNLSIENGKLNWQSDSEYNITIWRLDSTPHEFENYSHPYLATHSLTLPAKTNTTNISNWLHNWTGKLVITLESNGPSVLKSDSTNPTGSLDFNNEQTNTSEEQMIEPSREFAILIVVLLLLAILPAFYMYWQITRKNNDESE